MNDFKLHSSFPDGDQVLQRGNPTYPPNPMVDCEIATEMHSATGGTGTGMSQGGSRLSESNV